MEFYPDLIDIPPIIDFEASSLNSHHSYPISVGIVANGKTFYRLIRPKEEWTDWSLASESIHGLSKEHLLFEGLPVNQVLSDILAFLGDINTVYSDGAAWDSS